MSFTAVKLNPDKRMEILTLTTGEYITLDGDMTRPHYLDNESNIIVYMLRDPNPSLPVNRIASKLCGYKIFGAVIFINNTMEEIANEDQEAPPNEEDDDEEGDSHTDYEREDAYIEKNVDLRGDDVISLLTEYGIDVFKPDPLPKKKSSSSTKKKATINNSAILDDFLNNLVFSLTVSNKNNEIIREINLNEILKRT
jgi:hypothetical protein